jgi:putative transposase
MKKKRFSVEQIVAVLKQAELGVPVAEVIRKVGISEQTFYRWKKQYIGMETDQARQMETTPGGQQPVETTGCRSEPG